MIHCIVAQDVPTNGGAPPDLVGPIGPPVDTPLVFSARPCHFQKKTALCVFSAFRFRLPFQFSVSCFSIHPICKVMLVQLGMFRACFLKKV